MVSASKVLNSVLRQVKPDPKQRRALEGLAKKALSLTSKESKKYKAKAMLAGSITRDTWLPDKNEFDVFILFPESMKDKKMEEAGLKIGASVIKKLGGESVIEYAEHPYVSGRVGELRVDIVPAFAVESAEKIKSAVDRTPFHVRYIEKNLGKKSANMVRLLKQFMKASGCYGADATVEGFSGYATELLTISYKNFLGVLKAIKSWEPGQVIDVGKRYDKKSYSELKKRFYGQPLILVDPTDSGRNVAAALSPANFMLLKKKAHDFLSKPDTEFFFPTKPNPVSEPELRNIQSQRKTELILIKMIPPKAVPDVLWPQLKKFEGRVCSILEESRYEFRIMGSDSFTDGKYIAAVLIEMEVPRLPSVQKRIGPSIFDADDSKNFLTKYKDASLVGPYVEGENWVVETTRTFVTAIDKIHDSLSKPLDILEAKGVPKLIAERILGGFELTSDISKIAEESRRNPDFGAFLRSYFYKEKLV